MLACQQLERQAADFNDGDHMHIPTEVNWCDMPEEAWWNVLQFVVPAPVEVYLTEYERREASGYYMAGDILIPLRVSKKLQGHLLRDGSALLCHGQLPTAPVLEDDKENQPNSGEN